MAGQAQKKAAKAASSNANFYGTFVLLVNAVYLLWLVSNAAKGTEKWEALKAWSLSRQVLTAGGAAFCYWYAYTGLVAAAKLQTSTSTYVDLLGLTMVTQLASVFWDGAWLLLLLVPIIGLSSWLLPIIGMFRGAGGGGADEAGDSAADAKRQAKKERRASRARIIR